MGTLDSFITKPSHETQVPTIYAFETSGYSLTMLDKLEVAVSVTGNLAAFVMQLHDEDSILYVSFGTSLLLTAFQNGKFLKFRVVDNVSQCPVTFLAVADDGKKVVEYCPMSESLQIVLFKGEHTGTSPLYPSSVSVGCHFT